MGLLSIGLWGFVVGSLGIGSGGVLSRDLTGYATNWKGIGLGGLLGFSVDWEGCC